jgi:hypothetical protein
VTCTAGDDLTQRRFNGKVKVCLFVIGAAGYAAFAAETIRLPEQRSAEGARGEGGAAGGAAAGGAAVFRLAPLAHLYRFTLRFERLKNGLNTRRSPRATRECLPIRVPKFSVNAWPVQRHVYADIFLGRCPRRFVYPVDSELSLVKRLKVELNARKGTLQAVKD